MSDESANMAVMFTDIVGFTSATASQSREENQALLQTHNEMLLPLVDAFHGRHVKSIGDSLLVVFRSPTDALLCAMAMQDKLHEFNQTKQDTDQIHIRVAVNLGDVRIRDSDVFGDPVNVASRIESITPTDQIYFSESVYMTMNRAEVAAEEVGQTELPGISDPHRIYKIPRFAKRTLVAAEEESEADLEVSYPFGGTHLGVAKKRKKKTGSRSKFWWALLVVFLVLLVVGALFFRSMKKRTWHRFQRKMHQMYNPPKPPRQRPPKARKPPGKKVKKNKVKKNKVKKKPPRPKPPKKRLQPKMKKPRLKKQRNQPLPEQEF